MVWSQISVYDDAAKMGKPKYATAYNLAITLSDPWGRQISVVSMVKNNKDLWFFKQHQSKSILVTLVTAD